VVIPCYNEEENLKQGALDQVWRYLKKQPYSWEVIVSDDASSDNSVALAQQFARGHFGVKVLKNKHGGKPWAVWKGIEAARGELVLFTDMDQSTPIKEVAKLLPWFKKGYRVVIGSRGLRREGFPLIRRVGSLVFRFLRGAFVLPWINDTQCGFKALETEVAKQVFPQLQFFRAMNNVKGWRVSAFDVELLFIAQKKGYRIKEVEVNWEDEDLATGKEKNFIKESKDMAREVLRVRLNDWRGRYDR